MIQNMPLTCFSVQRAPPSTPLLILPFSILSLEWPVWTWVPLPTTVGVRERLGKAGPFEGVQNSTGWTGDFGKYLTTRFLKGTKEFVCVSKREINVRKGSQFSFWTLLKWCLQRTNLSLWNPGLPKRGLIISLASTPDDLYEQMSQGTPDVKEITSRVDLIQHGLKMGFLFCEWR